MKRLNILPKTFKNASNLSLTRRMIICGMLLFFFVGVDAQEYVELESKNEVTIDYKWKKKNFLKKNSPYLLHIRISNNSIQQKQVGFELLYYWDGVLKSRSGYKEYCIKPGQVIRGRKWDLVYQSDIKTLEEIHDRSFLWELDNFNTEDNPHCKTGLKLKIELQPSYKTNISNKSE